MRAREVAEEMAADLARSRARRHVRDRTGAHAKRVNRRKPRRRKLRTIATSTVDHDHGGHYNNVMRILVPLVISDAQLEEGWA